MCRKGGLCTKKVRDGCSILILGFSLLPSQTSFVNGGEERIMIIWLLIIETVTSLFADMAVKRLRNCKREEGTVARVMTRMIKNNLYK